MPGSMSPAEQPAVPVSTLPPSPTHNGYTYAPQIPWSQTGSPSVSAGRGYYLRFVPNEKLVIRSISFALQVADSANNPVYGAIYSSTGERLTVSASTLGLLNGSVPSISKIPVPAIPVWPNTIYYAFFLAPTINNAATATVFVSHANLVLNTILGTDMPSAYGLWENGLASPPSQATPVAAASGNVGPLLALRDD